MYLRSNYVYSGILAFLLLLVIGEGVEAQQRGSRGPSNGVVSGTVLMADANEPAESATVALWSASDSSLVTGAITKKDGSFEIEGIRPGSYYVRVSFVGYQSQTIPDLVVNNQNRQVDLGEIVLQEDTTELDEVQVSAEREYMQVEADKTVYNPQNQPVTSGGSARNVLEEIPSVDVDMDGSISLRGNQNVAIYLNGKPAPMSGQALTSFLEGLGASDIERVEVIPNPSARYEPEGMSGIINIVLAKNKDRGWGGGISASASTNTNYNGSANVNYGSGPWNIFSNYSARYGERDSDGSRFRANRYLDPMTYLSQVSSGERSRLSHTFNTSVDYQLSDLNTLSLTTVFGQRGGDSKELNAYSELDADSVLTRRYNRRTVEDRSDFDMDYRLDFKRVVEPSKHELTAELRYEQDWEDDGERYIQETLALQAANPEGQLEEEEVINENENEQEASAEVNYIRPLGESFGLEAGYKGDLERLNSKLYSESLNLNTGNFQPDVNRNNQFSYDEQIHAAYGIVKGSLGKVSTQIGLRAEQALTTFNQQTLGESYDNSYFSFFPSVHASLEPSRAHSFKISYSKRVRRPNTWQLNPFSSYDDPTFRRIGNPYLKPEYTHSFEVGYSRLANSYTLSISPYWRHTFNEISWHEELNNQGVSILTFENFETQDSYGLELIGSLTLGEWLKANGSFNAFKRVTDATNVQSSLSNSALGYMTRLRLTATIVEGLNLQVSQFYRSGHDIPGGSIGAFTRTNVALQQQVWGRRASLNLRASDVFGSSGFHIKRDTERFYQEFTRNRDSRAIQLTFRYNFGQQDRNRRRGDRGGNGGGEGGYGM